LQEYPASVREQAPAGIGRRDPTSIAMKQDLIELYLELTHFLAKGGLGYIQQSRGLGEAA